MVRTVLKYVAIGMLVLLVGAWLWSGGYRSIVNFVRTIPNPVDIIWGTSTSTYQIVLPWQISVPQGPDIELLLSEGDTYSETTPEERLAELEQQYESLRSDASREMRSPHSGKVALLRAAATESNPAGEYLVLEARYGVGSGASLRGWSLASMTTGVRVMIPMAAPIYEHGAINAIAPVVLEPGSSVIVVSGHSPTGVSFRENRCTGYLGESLSFEPALSSSCPSPAESISLTDQNLQRYGGDCLDYVNSLSQCVSPASIPMSLSAACRIYIANTFSYNGCVETTRRASDFGLDTWRLYIGSSRELWGNTHDAIRLLDESGRTVDSIIY